MRFVVFKYARACVRIKEKKYFVKKQRISLMEYGFDERMAIEDICFVLKTSALLAPLSGLCLLAGYISMLRHVAWINEQYHQVNRIFFLSSLFNSKIIIRLMD